MFDYFGNFPSFYTGYDNNNTYKIGILGAERNRNRISFRVIKSKLMGEERVTIPIGNKKDDSPLFFILIALGLSVIMALLFNSYRKLREDATRALIRPYNFFADIRDQRIISGIHTTFLMFILVGSHGLLLTNILFYLRTNMLMEKIFISLGSPSFISYFSFLAWNPVYAFFTFTIFSLFLFLLFGVIIKIASLFVRNRVLFSSIYVIVIWSFLPLVLFLPVELILYRVLSADVINIYLYLFLGVYALWMIFRLLKGIHVIFDVRPGSVYLFSILFLIVSIGVVILILQLREYSIYHIKTAFEQYSLM